MPLPKLDTPKYPIIIPSTKKKTFFRPFLMKEQKILMMALESQNTDQMMAAMCDLVKSCVDNIEDPESMPMFDIEFLFANIRAKSVGENIEVKIKCPKCDKKTETTVNIEEIEVKFPENSSNKIMLTEKMGVIMRYPRIKDAYQNLDSMDGDKIFSFIGNSIESVFDETSVYTRKDFSDEEILQFIESLNGVQFEQIANFYKNLPQLSKTVKYNCIHCKEEITIDFKGLHDFFT